MLLIYKVPVVHDSFMGYMIQALLDICISCISGHLQNCEFIGLSFLSVHPGLESVTYALGEYMAWCKGRLAPKDAHHDTSWLKHKPRE